MATIEEITALLQGMSEQNLDEIKSFIQFVRNKSVGTDTASWRYDFLDKFPEATITASRDPAGMEVKVADAVCGGSTRRALWEHPPVTGSCIVGFLVPVPTGLANVRVKFAIGIRDGAELPPDRFVAFRVLVNGWKLWSTVKGTHEWQDHEIMMPQVGSDVVRIEFVTDGLGHHQWDWAVWGLPRLEGETRK